MMVLVKYRMTYTPDMVGKTHIITYSSQTPTNNVHKNKPDPYLYARKRQVPCL